MNKYISAILGLLLTVGVFITLGYTPHVFISYLVVIISMYFYVSTKKIDNVLMKIIFLITIAVILGFWTIKKEGFYVAPLRLVSNSLTARECQDTCQSSSECRFAQVPSGTSNSYKKASCWNSYGMDQNSWGSEGDGGDTWTNRLYVKPITITGSWSGHINNSGGVREMKTTWLDPPLKVKMVKLTARLRDQGWGNPTWGIYIVGRDANGNTVFSEVVKAPRSKRTVVSWHCYGWWIFRRCYPYYRSVQGPRISNSTEDRASSNIPVKSIRVYAYSRGAGHSLDVDSANWSVIGYPV